MEGVRILEVAQFTFVPAAGAILADWGADVIKIEHPVRGDTQRGFVNMGGIKLDPMRHTLMEHPNRGKRSVGIDISTPEGQELLYEIAKTADVFLTNYLPVGPRRRTSSTSSTSARSIRTSSMRAAAPTATRAPSVMSADSTAPPSGRAAASATRMTPAELDGPLIAGHAGLRRFDRRHVHRRRHLRGPVPPRDAPAKRSSWTSRC